MVSSAATTDDAIRDARACRPLVSVVMNCYNGERYLNAAIDSVLSQTYENWEIIFWDNASDDGSGEIAQSYDEERFRYFRGDANVPLGQARNLALRQCCGEFVAFLDSDDIWLADKLRRQIPLFLNDKGVGIVYSDVSYFNEEQQSKRLYSMRTPYRGYCFQELLTDYCLCLSTCVIRMEILRELDCWFDESLNVCEESELFLRVGLRAKIDYVPDVLARYRVHDKSWTAKDPEAFLVESALILDKIEEIPGVREAHAKSIQCAHWQIARQEAKLAWRQGKSIEARNIIRDKLPFDFNSIVLFVATVIPFGALDFFYKKLSGVVRPVR